MLRSLSLLLLVGVITAQEEFFKRYAYEKVMAHCLGDAVYTRFLAQLAQAKTRCRNQINQDDDFSLLENEVRDTVRPFGPVYNYQGQRHLNTVQVSTSYQTREPNPYNVLRPIYNPFSINNRPQQPSQVNYNQNQPNFFLRPPTNEYQPHYQPPNRHIIGADEIGSAIDKVTHSLYNFTCVLRNMDVIDEDLDIKYHQLIRNYERTPIDRQLRNDFIKGISYCRDLVSCLPVNRFRSPLPAQLLRLMTFVKCEKKTRLASCFKHDLRNNLHKFDLSALPDDGGRSSNLEKLMTILIGAESADELEVF